MNKRITIITALILAAMLSVGVIEPVYAASGKKPAKPVITSAAANGTTVTISWKKAKNARKYEVARCTAKKTWVKFKTVKKSRKNKKKYTKASKYRVVARGNKYIVYKYAYKYTDSKKTTKRTVKYSGLDGNTSYIFAVRALNGKKYSAWRTVTLKTGPYYEWIKINGTAMKITEGQKVTIPLPNFPGVNSEKIDKKYFDIIPEKNFYNFYREDGTIMIYGKAPNGCDAYYVYYPGVSFSCGWDKYPSYEDRHTYGSISYGSGYVGGAETFSMLLFDDNKAVWTLDGKEPKYNEENTFINKSEYPFGTWTKEGDTLQMHGSLTGPGSSHISETLWTDSRGYRILRSAPIVVWAKLYRGDSLISEKILMDKE